MTSHGSKPGDSSWPDPIFKQIDKAFRQFHSQFHRIALPRIVRSRPGAMPGVEPHELAEHPSQGQPATITCFDYSPDRHQAQPVTDLGAFLQEHRPDWAVVRWIHVEGLGDMGAIEALARKYHLHPLAVEDLLNIPQRPKVELYDANPDAQARVFTIARMVHVTQAGRLHSQQVSLFLGHHTLITFLESPSEVWDPIRQRLAKAGTRLRGQDASFLFYALIDAIVDHFFPILEHQVDQLEKLEEAVLANPTPQVNHDIHHLRRHLLMIRRDIWPMRDMVQMLQRDTHDCLSEATRLYLRDVHDHAVQIIDLLETYREVASGLADLYMSAVSQRMNEVMKVLTIMGTIFIPLTFLAGVYGMNFHYMPEMNWKIAYPLFWIICGGITLGMVAWFRKRGWW